MPRVHLLNPNTSASATELMLATARRHAPPRMTLEGITARRGAPLIIDPAGLAIAADAVLELAPGLTGDGVIVAAFGDPGADALAARCDVPVIGIGEAAIRAAAVTGRRFSIVTTTPALEPAIRRRITDLGFAGQLASIRLTAADPAALTADAAALEAALSTLVDCCTAEDGAAAVIIGGGPLAGAAAAIAARTRTAIIEPVPAAVDWMARRLACGPRVAPPER